MGSSRNRSLAIVALLARHPWGLPATVIADALDIPSTATRRLIAGLIETGYLHDPDRDGRVRLRTRLPALGLAYLGASGIADVARTILEDLARRTGELVRLAVWTGEGLSWAAEVQGARTGLLYEPGASAEDFGPDTANGLAWLSSLGVEETAGRREIDGDGALALRLSTARNLGYASASKGDEVGTSAIAAPVRRPGSGVPLGTVCIAGPSIRLSSDRVASLAPWLLACAEELGCVASSSPAFRRPATAGSADPPPP